MAVKNTARTQGSAAYRKLVRYILTYESDTFSASGSKLTQKNAEKIANKIIADAQLGLDGVALSGYLQDVRRR